MRPALLLITALAASAVSAAPIREHILVGQAQGTDADAGRDLGQLLAAGGARALQTVATTGSVENVRRLATEPGARLALVQADVLGALVEQAAAGNPRAAQWVAPLRVVMPLFDEEVYFVVRSDSPLHHINDIRGQRVNVGPVGSGSAFTATRVYTRLFGSDLPAGDASFFSNEEALTHLTTDHSIDVVVVVSGQPARLFNGMNAQVRRSIRLLALDPASPEAKTLANAYAGATIRRESYQDWLQEDVPSISVKTVLMTRNYQTPAVRSQLVGVARALCIGASQLRADGHVKWRDVNVSQPELPQGWSYYLPTHEVLSNCSALQEADAQATNRRLLEAAKHACAASSPCGKARRRP